MRIFSLNVEGDKHLDAIGEFAKDKQFSVVALCEVFQKDIPLFEGIFGVEALFVPMVNLKNHPRFEGENIMGIALLVGNVRAFGYEYYIKHGEGIPDYVHSNPNSTDRALLWADIEIDGKFVRIALTHFTWTPDGETTKEQRKDLQALLVLLDKVKPDILLGDFNAARGKEIFDRLAQQYQDNVPAPITSSLDPQLHRAGPLPLMVDVLFTKKDGPVNITNIEQVFGVSDHTGFVAEINAASEQ